MRPTDYDRYYASLAASTNGTPAAMPGGDDFGGSDDEDRKPDVQYLNSLSDYRKRSRSRSDVGTHTPKLAKLHDNGFEAAKVNGNDLAASNGDPHAILVDGAPAVDPTVFGSCLLLRLSPIFIHTYSLADSEWRSEGVFGSDRRGS